MLESKFLVLPGVKKFLEEVSEDLENGKNCIVFMPYNISNNIFDSLKNILREESNCEILNTEHCIEKPLDRLFYRFINNPEITKSTNSLFENLNLSKYLFLNLCNLNSQISQLWFDFLSDYSTICTQKDRNHRLKFCLIVNHSNVESKFPEKSPALSHFIFYNYLSELDFHFCIDETEEMLEPMDYELLKSLLFEFAFPDLDLIFHLINDIKGFLSNPIEKIESFYIFSKEVKLILDENENTILKEIRFKENLTIKHKLFKLWLVGLVRYKGKEFNPSSMALIFCRKINSLKNREWLAQLKILFPLIEKNRIKIAEWIMENMKSQTYIEFLREFGESDIINLEVGKLHHILINSRDSDIKITELAAICRTIRNNLAHRNAVNESLIKEFASKAKIASIVNENDH